MTAPRRFAALGDTLVAGVGVGERSAGVRPVGWVDRLAEALGAAEYRNVAVRDRRIDEIVDVQLPAVLDVRPDLVLVNGGATDMVARDFDAAHVAARFEAMVQQLAATGAHVVVFTMPDVRRAIDLPEAGRARLSARFDPMQEMVRATAKRSGATLLDFGRSPLSRDRTVYSSDLVHLTVHGHALLAGEALRTLVDA